MRVEFVSPYDYSPHTGIGRYVHTMVQHLFESVDVAICRPQFLPMAGRYSTLRNLPIGIEDHIPGSIVHFPQIMGCAMMLCRPYHPSVATVHDLGFLELPEEWQMLDPVARQMLRLSLAGLKRVDMIVAVSEFTRQGVIKHLAVPQNRVVTIHSGIDHELFRPIPDAREVLIGRYAHLAPIASAPWILYVGSELPRKNTATLLRAMAQVREQIPDIRLLKVGSASGEQYRRETLRVVDELGLEDHILLFEDVSKEELPLFYAAADLFVTVSRLEGFGFPVAEAMACGTPVICSNAGALPEVVGDVALMLEPCDVSGFVKAIVTVLKDSNQRNQRIAKGLERGQFFSWERTIGETLTVYSKLQHEQS